MLSFNDMSMINQIRKLKTSPKVFYENIILIAGAGQNVGKTTFACDLIKKLKNSNHQVYALKISPHIHKNSANRIIFEDEYFSLSLENRVDTNKDSSRMLAAGAAESFFLQVNDEYLKKAFEYTASLFPKNVVVVVESGGLRKILKPNYFFFLQRRGEALKEKSAANKALANQIVEFDGEIFDYSIEQLFLKDGLLNLND